MNRLISIFVILCLTIGNLQAQKQDKRLLEKSFYKALDYIYQEDYNQALNILYSLDTIALPHFLKNSEEYQFYIDSQFVNLEQVYVKYLIAVCHLENNGKPETALPYIEYVLQSGYSNTPSIIYKDLGRLYHLDYQFNKSIHYFKKYIENTNRKDEYYLYAKHMIQTCINAKNIVKDTIYKDIDELRGGINTPSASENRVLVNADNSTLFFQRDYTDSSFIYVSKKKMDIWLKAKKIIFPREFIKKDFHIELAGMDYPQKNIVIYLRSADSLRAFKCTLADDKVIEIMPLHFSFLKPADGRFCYGKTEKEIYFSSNREGGTGSYDIYKVSLSRDLWKNVENLKNLNTPYDEIDPFYDRLNNKLYFSSAGFNSMGGFDFYYSMLNKNVFTTPVNVGFAINTVKDDISFVKPLNSNEAYYCSEQKNSLVLKSIFHAELSKNIPLTLLNGTFRAGNPPRPIKVSITVIDRETNKKIKYAFNSQKSDGKYYIIFKPGKIYDLIFKSAGFMPQLVTINVPQQKYFYQLFQTVSLIPLDSTKEAELSELNVSNNFSDMDKTGISNTKKQNAAILQVISKYVNNTPVNDTINQLLTTNNKKKQIAEKNYENLLNLIETTIQQADTAAINQLFEKSKSTEVYSITYNSKLNAKKSILVIGTDTIKTAPPLKAYSDLASEHLAKILGSGNMIAPLLKDTLHNSDNLVFQYEMVMQKSEITVSPKYFPILNDVIELLNKNPYLQLIIEGISQNSYKNKAEEMRITKQKASIIANYLQKHNCQCKDIFIQATLQPNVFTKNLNKEYYFILVKIFDLNK